MALTKFLEDLNIIRQLDDEPNDVGGLSAQALKAAFDEGGLAIQAYLNNTLTSEIDSTLATKQELQSLVLGQIPDGTITADKLSPAVLAELDGKADDALSPALSAELGLSGDAPKTADALRKLGGAVHPLQDVWDKYLYSESVGGFTQTVTLVQQSSSGGSGTIAYSSAFTYNTVKDRLELVSPQTLTLSYENSAAQQAALQGKYTFGTSEKQGSTLYRLNAENPLTVSWDFTYYYVRAANAAVVSVSQSYIGQVQSFAPDAYPADGVVGDYRYCYLGRPGYIGTQIKFGHYIGTGTYGSANKNCLSFEFVPRLVMVYHTETVLQGSGMARFFLYAANMTQQQVYSSSNGYYRSLVFSLENKSLSWHAISNQTDEMAAAQLNVSGTKYHYLALG